MRGKKKKMMLPNKHITKWQLPFDVLFQANFFFSKYICLETTIKLLSPVETKGEGGRDEKK